ncbi:MAG: hypothetical protein ACRD8Z_01900, partial [Nitrososphaeraceae archaeon]
SPDNFTEFSSDQFNVFIPPTTPKGEHGSENFPAGSHGWWVLLEPLSPVELGVTSTVRNAALALLIANINFPGTEVISTIAAYGVLTFAVVVPYASYWKKRHV